jgi:ribonuclease BN (tRNA processing enzyme)
MIYSPSITIISVLNIVVVAAFFLCHLSCTQSLNTEISPPPVLTTNVSHPSDMAEQPKATRKSDFGIITLGTGSPVYSSNRSGPSTLIRYRNNYFLVDMGNGTQARLNEASIPIGDIGTLIFTHHHIDHDEEFLPIFIQAYLRRGNDVNIFGPSGTKELHDFASRFYREDINYRVSRAGKKLEGNINMNVRELAGGSSLELNGVGIRTAQVVHTILTIAYRFEVEGKSIVVSGDTSYSDDLIELAKGADILVMDSGGVTMKENPQPNQQSRPANKQPQLKVTTNGSNRAHSTLHEVATMADKAQAKCLVLTHFAPGEVDKDATSQAIKAIFKGTVIFGEDLMEINCP